MLAGRVTTGDETFNIELVFVQLRKTLELIAFASLTTNKQKYSAAYANFATHWRVKDTLKALEKINPDFYPVPLKPPQSGQKRRLLLGLFHGVPTTKKSIFDVPTGPDHIVLYQKNIEAVCSSEAEVREQIRLTVIHELGHYFGMDENQLKDV